MLCQLNTWYAGVSRGIGNFHSDVLHMRDYSDHTADGEEVRLLEYAATVALSVVVMVSSIGAISGAHVNPAVTIAFATCALFPWSKVGTKRIYVHTWNTYTEKDTDHPLEAGPIPLLTLGKN
jgi:hypothetical protein